MEGTQAKVIFWGTEQGDLKSVVYITEESRPLGDSKVVKVDSRVHRPPLQPVHLRPTFRRPNPDAAWAAGSG